jgi:hypothetical protein
LLLLASAGCSSDGDGDEDAVELDPLEQIEQATFEAGSARYAGEIAFADGTTGPIEGTSQAEPPAGDVRYPIATASGPQEVRVVWFDGSIYVDRVVTTSRTEVSLTRHLEASLPWARTSYQPLTVTVFEAYDPFRLLEWLTARNAVARPDGTEQVGDDDLSRYVVDLTGQPITPGGAQTIELLADADMRLQVARLTGADRIEYAVSEYGAEVAPTPPPDDQVDVPGTLSSYEPTGPFEVVARGTSGAGPWQVLRAPGTDGATCWRLQTESPLDPVAATNPDGVTCIEAFDPEADVDDQVRVVADAGSGASFDAIVAVVPPGSTSASMQFTDRTSQELAIDPAGVVVWVGPKPPLAVVLDVVGPDGAVASCGPGSVTELADLERLSESERQSLDRAPWLCLSL